MRPRTVLVAGAAIHVVLAIALAAGALRPFYNDIRNRPGPAADFFAVYHAGRQVWTGRSPFAHDERPRVTPSYFAPFRYPPGVAWTLGVAIAKVKPWIAYAVWIVVLEALLVLGIVRMRELIANPAHLAWTRAAWLAFPPWFLELWMGQFTFVAAMLTFLAILQWRRDRPRSAAAMWAVACALKLFPLTLAPAVVMRRRFGAIAAALLVTAAALAPLLATEGAFAGFFGLNVGAPEPTEVHAGNFSLLVLLHRIVEAITGAAPDAATWIWVARGLAVGFAAVVTAAMWRARRDDLALSAAAALWLLPLISKDSWEHHSVIALPAIALMVAAFANRPRWLAATAVAWSLVALPSLL
ncbi:MAG TPA: glycosyltransferase family 87 protein, partial [Kofleriaceae bacterium]